MGIVTPVWFRLTKLFPIPAEPDKTENIHWSEWRESNVGQVLIHGRVVCISSPLGGWCWVDNEHQGPDPMDCVQPLRTLLLNTQSLSVGGYSNIEVKVERTEYDSYGSIRLLDYRKYKEPIVIDVKAYKTIEEFGMF